MKINGILKVISIQILVIVAITEIVLWIGFPVTAQKKYENTVTQNISGLKDIITYKRNEFGFRSLSMMSKAKPDNTIRIICLGASTTDQTTQSNEDTWSGQLEKKLNQVFRDQNIHVEVAAMGRSGQLIKDRLSWIKTSLLEYQPDIVIMLEGINDLAFGGQDEKVHHESNSGNEIETIAEKISKVSQIVRRLKIIKAQVQTKRALQSGEAVEWHSEHLTKRQQEYRQLPYVEMPQRLVDPYGNFKNNFDDIIHYLSDNNIHPIVLSQPVLYEHKMNELEYNAIWFPINFDEVKIRPSLNWLVKEVDKYNEVQKDIAKKYNGDFVDLNKQLPKTLKVFFDDCHFTDYGSELIAQAIVPSAESAIRKIINE